MIVKNPIPITEDELIKLAKRVKGRITTIYLHWTAGHYGQVYDDYHLNIDQDGKHDINDTRVSAGIR